MSATRVITAAALSAAVLTVAAQGAGAAPGAPATENSAAGKHDRAASRSLVATVRRAVSPYTDVAAAGEAGYVPQGQCEATAEGGMGVHYVNPDLLMVTRFDPERPPILLYGPDGEGGLRLLGAEYMVPDVGQPRPEIAGESFDGPMPGHAPGMPVHYDLHIWTHVANPAGVFAPWNPLVDCGW